MKKKNRALTIVAGLGLAVFGFFCWNYTKPGTLEHHQEWAAESGLPAPTDEIAWVGLGAMFVAGVLVGRR